MLLRLKEYIYIYLGKIKGISVCEMSVKGISVCEMSVNKDQEFLFEWACILIVSVEF